MALFPILTASGDTIVTSDGFAIVVQGGTAPSPTSSSLLVLSDRRDLGQTDAVTLNRTTGAITAHIPSPTTLPFAAAGDTVADGHFLVSAQIANSNQCDFVKGYDSSYSEALSLTALAVAGTATFNPASPIVSDGVSKWYLGIIVGNVVTVHELTIAGLTGSSWVLTAHGAPAKWIGRSRAPSTNVLYYTETGTKPIYAWDLTGNVALPNFVTNSGTDFFESVKALINGDVLVLGQTNSSVATPWCVRRYNSAGTLQQTYTLGVHADAYELPFLFLDYNDESVFWVKAFPDATGHTATYYNYNVDGTLIASFTVDSSIVDDDGKVPSTCPEMVLSVPGIQATTYPIRRLRRFAL